MEEPVNQETVAQAVLWFVHRELTQAYANDYPMTERQADILRICEVVMGRDYQPSEDMKGLLDAIIAAPLAVNS